MKIEIWSDYVCPFCYIGKRKLEKALAQLPFIGEVEIAYKSYELDPNAKMYDGVSIDEAISQKYGIPLEQAKASNEGIVQAAKEVGLSFDFNQMKPTNTLDAHRLTKFAKTKGKEEAMLERLYQAYFEEGVLISDEKTLIDLGVEVGLESEDVTKVLRDQTAFLGEVRTDETTAAQLGITSAPYFVLNDKYAVKGAQPVELFIRALTDVWSKQVEEEKEVSQQADMVCDDDGCHVPNS